MSPFPVAADRDVDVDTVIVGNGPSALILSFILHGNIPYYDVDHPHPDPILHKKLGQSPCLLDLDVDELTAHFDASRISYSTQALPVNVLLDTLLRPLSDIEPGEHPASVVWRYESHRAVKHLIVGDTSQAGGQWAENPVDASWDIGTLSYLEQLSLPKYTLFDHFGPATDSLVLTCERPTRRQIAEYLAAYPAAVGIQHSIRTGTISDVSRTSDGFHIASHNISCKHLVLASGIFTSLITPPPKLQPLLKLGPHGPTASQPLLVVGSGFSAADIIISSVERRKIIHVFKWQPDERPSPLQACHPQAYPEYAGVYRQMKGAVRKYLPNERILSPTPRKQKRFFDEWVWSKNYVGLPNTEVKAVELHADMAVVKLQLPDGSEHKHEVCSLAYVVGRRGSLDYLVSSLRQEVVAALEGQEGTCQGRKSDDLVSGRTLRDKVGKSVEVAPNVFAIGSLTGDSLIRFSHGGCVQSAGRIIGDSDNPQAEKLRLWQESKLKEEVVIGNCLPDNGGHEDLGRDPEVRNPIVQSPSTASKDRFRWSRRKSSCVVS